MHDQHAAAWKPQTKGKLVADTAAYLPKEISHAAARTRSKDLWKSF